MGRRREQRIAINLSVIVRGQDSQGNPFRQSARTLDISRTGARLDGIVCLPGPGVPIEVEYKGQKTFFSVKWIGPPGTRQAGQIGIRSLSPDRQVWKEQLPPPGPDPFQHASARPQQSPNIGTPGKPSPITSPPHGYSGAERRRYSRQQCRISAQIATVDGGGSMKGTITDLSLSGCFVEMLSPLPVNTEVTLVTDSIHGIPFTARGVIRISLQGMGVGIEFTLMSPQDRLRLAELAPLSKRLTDIESPYSQESPAIETHAASNGANGKSQSQALENAIQAIVRVLVRKGVLTQSEIEHEIERQKVKQNGDDQLIDRYGR
jgi:hypothetical protein